MQIPPEKIEEIIARTDLVALVSRYVELKPSGRSLKGLCPFHGEKTPSFHVNPERRTFKCFGCDLGGDAISFLKRINGQSFIEVVRDLAREAGVSLEEREDPAAKLRAQLREATEFARRHFEERLWSDPRARPGREHLAKRGVSEAIARQFGLGYALNGWNDLSDRLVKEGILEWGANAGLCSRKSSGDGFYDSFRGRLMIPIRSAEGRTVAFGARLVEEPTRPGAEPGPKYLNSRESPLYRKSEVLYGLDLAREEIRRQKCAVLVEGYFDVIGLHAAGVHNAVALCSTALTAGHLTVLQRFDAQKLVLLLDGDDAGLKAVERLAGPIFAAGARAHVACLPQGDDPDTFALREGQAGTDALIAGAAPLSQHLLQRALPGGPASSFEQKMAALARLKPILEQIPAGMTKSVLLGEIASHLGVAESELRAELLAEARPPRTPRPGAAAGAAAGAAGKASASGGITAAAVDPQEAFYAALLVYDPALREAPEARFTEELRSVDLRLLLESAQPGEELAVGGLREPTRAALSTRLEEIKRTLGGEPEFEARRKALRDVSTRLRLTRVEERIAEGNAELHALQENGSEEQLVAVQQELIRLNNERKRLKARDGGGPGSTGGAA